MKFLTRSKELVIIFLNTICALIIKTRSVWRLLNRIPSKLLKLPSDFYTPFLNQLKREGLTTLSVSDFGDMKNDFIEIKSKYFDSFKNVKEGSDVYVKKDFFRFILGGNYPREMQHFSSEDPVINLAKNKELIRIINNYLGTPAKLIYVEANISNPDACKEDKKKSQNWHRDPGIHGCVKVFIYFNDVVTEGHGPFMYLKDTHEYGKYNNEFAQKFFGYGGKYPNKDEVNSHPCMQKKHICFGNKGTIILADTTGIHAGGYSVAAPRMMLTLVYYPKSDFQKQRLKINSKKSEPMDFTRDQAYLLGLK